MPLPTRSRVRDVVVRPCSEYTARRLHVPRCCLQLPGLAAGVPDFTRLPRIAGWTVEATLDLMTNDSESAEHTADDVRVASDRWWSAYQSGAPAEVVQTLWAELAHLCRAKPAPAPMENQADRFAEI